MTKKCVFKENGVIKDVGKGNKFGLDNLRAGGGDSWESQKYD